MTALGDAPQGDFAKIRDLLTRTKARFNERDQRMQHVLAVRQGRMRDVFPDLFPEGPYDRGIVANMVDVAARDLSEVLAPLPAVSCSSGKSTSDASVKFAVKRSKIANGYLTFSDVQVQSYTAADRYVTYGFVPAMVEIDTEARMPRIRFMDSVGAYPIFNRWGEIEAAYFTFFKTRDELLHMYPDALGALAGAGMSGSELIEVARYHDKNVDLLFLPNAREATILESARNPLGECMVVWTQRPGVDSEAHGQFDDVLAVQVAKARFALLSLEAATKAVQAPIVMPQDVQELAIGPDSVIRTDSGDKVRRVPVEVPSSAFAQQSVLDQELRQGSRFPDARAGNIDGSIVTGRGVQALMSGFDTQVRTGQAMFAQSWSKLIRLCFAVDEKLWGSQAKTIRGNADGTPYEIEYRPDRDIKGDYTVDVQYGLMAGLEPNRALVFGLQAQGGGLVSREFLRTQMPFPLDSSEQEQKIDVENLRDALKQAVAGYVQSIPVMAQQGINPSDAVAKVAKIIMDRQKGDPIEKIVSEVFAPEPPTPAENGVEPPVDQASPPSGQPGEAPPGGGGAPPGMNENGLLQGVATGQAGMAPGGRPDLQMLLASIGNNGQPNMTAGVSRRRVV